MKGFYLILLFLSLNVESFECPDDRNKNGSLHSNPGSRLLFSVYKLILRDKNNINNKRDLGTAILVSESGYAITADHLFSPTNHLIRKQILNNKKELIAALKKSSGVGFIEFPAKEIENARDGKNDLTIIKIDHKNPITPTSNFIKEYEIKPTFFEWKSTPLDSILYGIGFNLDNGEVYPLNFGTIQNGNAESDFYSVNGITVYNGYSGTGVTNQFSSMMGVLTGKVKCDPNETYSCKTELDSNAVKVIPIKRITEVLANVKIKEFDEIIKELRDTKFDIKKRIPYFENLAKQHPLFIPLLLEKAMEKIFPGLSIDKQINLGTAMMFAGKCILPDVEVIEKQGEWIKFAIEQSIAQKSNGTVIGLINTQENDLAKEMIDKGRRMYKEYTKEQRKIYLDLADQEFDNMEKQYPNFLERLEKSKSIKDKKYLSNIYYDFYKIKINKNKYGEKGNYMNYAGKALSNDVLNPRFLEAVALNFKKMGEYEKALYYFNQSYVYSTFEEKLKKAADLGNIYNLAINKNPDIDNSEYFGWPVSNIVTSYSRPDIENRLMFTESNTITTTNAGMIPFEYSTRLSSCDLRYVNGFDFGCSGSQLLLNPEGNDIYIKGILPDQIKIEDAASIHNSTFKWIK